MRQNRRMSISEINLTPLLDVLFSILFIVMMAGEQNEAGLKENYQQQIEQLTQQNTHLAEELKRTEDQISSYNSYQSEAIILTVSNMIRDDNHYLIVYQGLEKEEVSRIQMGVDKIENTKARIESLIVGIVDETDNQPVYIIFHCNKKQIYRIEYEAVEEVFNQLQGTNKEVFFKVMEEE